MARYPRVKNLDIRWARSIKKPMVQRNELNTVKWCGCGETGVCYGNQCYWPHVGQCAYFNRILAKNSKKRCIP